MNRPNQYDAHLETLLDHFLTDGRIDAAERAILSQAETLALTAAAGMALMRTGELPRRLERERPDWRDRMTELGLLGAPRPSAA